MHVIWGIAWCGGGVPPAASEVPPGVTPSRHLREARHNRNRLQANVVSVAGGKTASLSQRPKGATKPHGGERNLDAMLGLSLGTDNPNIASKFQLF